MPIPLTINSFLLGYRTETAKTIIHNPFYNVLYDRSTAEAAVVKDGLPILRDSSHHGLYAVTFHCSQRKRIVHSLLRENSDNSIDVLSEAYVVYHKYSNIYELLSLLLWGSASLRRAPVVNPSSEVILPAAPDVAVRDASRTFIMRESSEDPINS